MKRSFLSMFGQSNDVFYAFEPGGIDLFQDDAENDRQARLRCLWAVDGCSLGKPQVCVGPLQEHPCLSVCLYACTIKNHVTFRRALRNPSE